jgi:hypothetical protein
MFIYKKLKASDANTIAFEAHKEYNIDKDNTASLGVSLLDSSYSSASRDTYSLFDINNHKQYFQLDHLFYKDALFNYGNLIGGIDYNNQEKRLYDKATIISLSQKTFGSGVQKGTFLFNNTYIDDSKGNLYDQNTTISDFPTDKERVFYLGPVKGFKSVDLTRDPNTGEPIVNAATSYNDLKLDDSLYINPVEYISCSFARNTTLNCTEVDLTNGYIKAPNSNNYNFGNEDFTISFYYQAANVTSTKYVLAKSKTQTVVEYPESNLDGSLKNTHGSASLLQPKEVDAGKAFPFEIIQRSSLIEFKRADQDTEVSHTSTAAISTGDTLYHIACVKTGSELKIYLDGALSNGTGTDTTDLCQNKADLFIGTNPTISSSKLDNTHDQSISQLMIWNRGLTATEIANVSESIDGSPYVGNIFYENGIATLTSPKVNSGTLTSLQDTSGIITLDNTPYVQGDGTEIVLPQPTFSGSLTFTSSRETLEQLSGSQIFDLLSFNSTYVSASLTGDVISLTSKPYALIDDYIINTIQTETFDTYNSYALLNPIVDAIPGGIGTGSGDRGTDGDSITTTEDISSAFEGVFLAENQTVTESINVLFISNSQDIIADDFVGDSSISDTPFTLPTGITEYVDTPYAGLYVKAGTPSGVDAWFSGSMAMTIAEDITAANTEQTNIAFDTSVHIVPDGVDDGAQYTQFDGGSINAGTIELLNADFDYTNQPLIYYRITTTGFAGSIGPNYNLKVRIRYAGGTQLHMDQFNSVSAFQGTVEGYVNILANPNIVAGAGTKFEITLQYDTNDPNFPNGGGNDAKFNVDAFGLFQPTSPFNNELRLTNSIPTKLSSIYHISCSKINPNPNLPAPDNNLVGLKQADDGNTLGVKTALWKRLNGAGSYSLITQSFYPSGSNTNFVNNNFEFTHQTSDTDTEDLKFTVVSDTAENIIPSTTGDPNTIPIKGVPISSSLGIGTLGGDYVVNETSASNVLHIQNGIENHFTASENISSQITFNDTSNFVGNTTSPIDILGFQNNDSTKILLGGNYLATSSFAASTASLERGNFISGSASIDITGTKGLYKVEAVTLGTSDYPGTQTQTAIGENQKLRIQTKKNGALQDTKYIQGNTNSQNAFQTEDDKLNLGLLTNTDNISFEFTVVDSDNNIDKVTKNQGFNIREIQLSKLTSSNEVTQVNGDSFPTNLDALYFSSSHLNTGNASIPFTTGQVTASIASISADGLTITLDNDLFITSSLTDALFHVSGAENGPFIISASYSLPTQVIGTNKEYQIEELSSNININDPGAGTGFGTKIKLGNTTVLQESFQDGNTTITNDITYRNSNAGGASISNVIEFFVSGVASPLYPDGAVTASLNYTQSIITNVTMSAISGSNISSGDTFTAGEFGPFDGYESDTLGITSSHTTDPHEPNQPLYTLGKQDIDIVTRTSDGHIKVDQILFITASSKATGSSDSSSFTPGDYSFTSLNPIEATGVTSDMLGGTFEFQDLGTLQTSEYQITAIDGNEITLENLDGGSNAIQTVNESNLTNTPEVTVNFSEIVANEFTIQYKNSHLIFENEFHCTVDEDEYNFTLNPTARKNKDINKGDLANFATGSNFKPYVTTVGLYNEAGELLVVGKFGQPIRMSDETDTTFVVRYDT